MKRSLFGAFVAAALLSAIAAPAYAQPVTALTYPGQSNTYSATVTGASPAASLTDLLTISGVAGKSLQVRKITISGVSTAAAAGVIKIVKRSTLDTGGTAGTAPTKVPYNSNIGIAAGATVKIFTANPTLGTAVGDVASGELVTGPAASATGNPPLVFDFSNQQVFLNSATESLAVNGNGASLSAGAAVNVTVEWQE